MTNTFIRPVNLSRDTAAIAADLIANAEAQRSNFSSTVRPVDPPPVTGQAFYDTDGDFWEYWSGTAWRPLLIVPMTFSIPAAGFATGALTDIFVAERACIFIQGSLVTDTNCATNDTNYYSWKLLRAGSTDINAAATTQVTGGAAVTAHARFALGAVSAEAIAANTVVQFKTTFGGTPNALDAATGRVTLLLGMK